MSKSVKFRRESPSSGSLYDHQRSDSGVGSFSDSESRTAYASVGSNYDGSPYSILQQAYDRECDAKDRWKKKAGDLDALLVKAHKDLKETEARLRALEDRVETLGEEKSSLVKTNKDLSEENARLKEDLKEFKDIKKAARRKTSSPPVPNVTPVPADSEDKKPRRTSSRRHSISERAERDREIEKEMEKEKERDMERLRKRFEKDPRGDESDAKSSNTSSRSHRSRRDSYVEPLGPIASRPQPPSPSRGYAYTVQHNQQPQQQPQTPQFLGQREGNTPRVVHPTVTVSYTDTTYDEEDGNYHPYPLPKQQRPIERRERRP